MGDTDNLNNQNTGEEQKATPLKDSVIDHMLTRLLVVENAVKAAAGATETQKGKSNPDDDLLKRVKAGEVWMICLTALIFCVSAFQAYETWTNNSSTGKQVDQIITAAARIDDASDSFSKSSADMSRGITDAVSQLGLQAKEIEEARKSSVAQSEASLKASIDDFHQEQRAWVGIGTLHCQRCAYSEKAVPQDASKTLYTVDIGDVVIRVTNTGKTPAQQVHSTNFSIVCRAGDPVPEFSTVAQYIEERSQNREASFSNCNPANISAATDDSISVIPPNLIETLQSSIAHERQGQYGETTKRGTIPVIYLLGEITYMDVFSQKMHSTRYCAQIGNQLQIDDSHPLDFGFCSKGNTMN